MLERPAIRCASRPPLLAQSRGDGSLFPPPERALGRNNSRLPTVVAPGCVTVICVLCAVGARLALPPPRSCRTYNERQREARATDLQKTTSIPQFSPHNRATGLQRKTK